MVSVADIPPETLVSIFERSERHKDLLNYALEPDHRRWGRPVDQICSRFQQIDKVKSNFVLTTQGALNYSRRRDEHSGDTLFQNVRQLILPMGSTDFQTASIACSSGAPKSIRMNVVPGSRSETGWMFQTPALSLAGRGPNVESIHADCMFSYDAPLFSSFARLRVLECYSFTVRLRW
ncbi:hypothetical protein M407DRAFT_19182 [Tulasnella calospora MUT 4182]|uniref:Uncharacterized protein n=1 Tax=Tulasnella calospora MUT 4182 TaxID=1051891 RepID=A0A0C3QIL7_9AGAM|nr:hypothetical protein M407DRAFT_19182 [Tulasnella calospora MUT 4182]